jgi:2-polyprenyl-3-methyl-5-hydroxy-6-metoxy-1,4-benzoquinol methylase
VLDRFPKRLGDATAHFNRKERHVSSNIEWNKQNWSDPKRWETEWHGGYAWGGRDWVRRDFLRFVAPWLPDGRPARVLEIACGMGRFTEVLLEMGKVEHVHGIDLSEHCVESCRQRFPERFTGTCTDGRTLPDGSYDLVVSYDSLVHADLPVLTSYFEQSVRVLEPGGHIVVHHANQADYESSRMDVSAGDVFELVKRISGLEMVSQTLFRVKGDVFIDCCTVARHRES